MNITLTIRSKISETCKVASMAVRRFTGLELIYHVIRMLIFLQNPTVFLLGEGTISLSY